MMAVVLDTVSISYVYVSIYIYTNRSFPSVGWGEKSTKLKTKHLVFSWLYFLSFFFLIEYNDNDGFEVGGEID